MAASSAADLKIICIFEIPENCMEHVGTGIDAVQLLVVKTILQEVVRVTGRPHGLYRCVTG